MTDEQEDLQGRRSLLSKAFNKYSTTYSTPRRQLKKVKLVI